MKVVSSLEMRELDRRTIEEYGLPSIVLMENAALATVEAILEVCPRELLMRGVVVLCGSGNNAGDGLAIARHLILRRYPVRVFLMRRPKKPDPLVNYEFLKKLNADVTIYSEDEEDSFWRALSTSLELAGCVVDALLGTGVKGELAPEYVRAIRAINRVPAFKVSVDLPSGINPDTGALLGPEAVKANLTVTMGFPKRGLLLYPGAEYVGKLVVANISIPLHLSRDVKEHLLLPEEASLLLPERSPLYHKYKCGTVVLIGGPKPFTGASHLASLAALRGGAGMVYLLVPEEAYLVADAKLTEVIVDTYSFTNGFKRIEPYLARADVVVVGMGWGYHESRKTILRELIKNFKGRIVIDGDALRGLAELMRSRDVSYEELEGRIVLTPHSGELQKFFEIAMERSVDVKFRIATEYQRYRYAKRLSYLTGGIVVAKGNPTLVVREDEVFYVASTGVSMAKAGTGDALAGVIGAIASQDIPLERGVALATMIHGMAAQLSREKLSHFSVTASDIIDSIPKAIDELFRMNLGQVSRGRYKSLLERMGLWEL